MAALHSLELPADPCLRFPLLSAQAVKPSSSNGKGWTWQLFSPPGVQTPSAKVPPLLKQSSALMQLPISVLVALELVQTVLQAKNVVSMLTPWHTSTGP